jgi:DNA-binding NarL/FixJ family response regulator
VDVLVVDDSVGVRTRVVAQLREAGLAVIGEAGSVAETLACVAAQRPDAIVLDLSLPDGSGLDLLQTLRARVPAAIIVVLTNASPPGYRKSCLARGASFVFDKSSEFESVVPALLGGEYPHA